MKFVVFALIVAAFAAFAIASVDVDTIPRGFQATDGSLVCGEILKKAKSARLKDASSSSVPEKDYTLLIALVCGIGGGVILIAAIIGTALLIKRKKAGKDVNMTSVGSGAAPVYDTN